MRESASRGHAPTAGAEEKFDLVLVVEYFRTSIYFLSIIKYLARKYRIALYPVTIDPGQLAKQRSAQERFISLCVRFGATLLRSGPVAARVALVPQRPFLREALDDVRDNIRADVTLGALSFAWAGQPTHDAFLRELGIGKAYVIDRSFVDFLLSSRKQQSAYDGIELVEVGLPYGKYPVFPEFSADYLLAIPTPFSFPHERDKWQFLESVLGLFAEIGPDDVVVHKPHNATEEDQFSTAPYRRTARLLGWTPGLPGLWRRLGERAPRKLRKHFGKLFTAFLYERVLRRTVPMPSLTPDYDMALEAFLPGVRKGVIGGLSNTIWGTLHAGLPYYNCVDAASQRPQDEQDRLYGKKQAERALGINMEFFAVPFCDGKLAFDARHFDIVSAGSRRGDLIADLDAMLSAARGAR